MPASPVFRRNDGDTENCPPQACNPDSGSKPTTSSSPSSGGGNVASHTSGGTVAARAFFAGGITVIVLLTVFIIYFIHRRRNRLKVFPCCRSTKSKRVKMTSGALSTVTSRATTRRDSDPPSYASTPVLPPELSESFVPLEIQVDGKWHPVEFSPFDTAITAPVQIHVARETNRNSDCYTSVSPPPKAHISANIPPSSSP